MSCYISFQQTKNKHKFANNMIDANLEIPSRKVLCKIEKE